MPSHEATTAAFTRVIAMASEADARALYLAATKGVPDGNLHLALDMAIRDTYQPHVLAAWKAGR
jgi:hypothetical protein